MGAQTSLIKPLQALLKARKLKVSERTLEGFIKEVDRHAPWYVVSGSLTPRSWEKLGKDLQRAKERDRLSPGVMPLWRLIRACLEDDRCKEAVTQGRDCLQLAQDSLSETEREERVGTKLKQEKGVKKNEKNDKNGHSQEKKSSLYPISELEKLKVAPSSSDTESLDSEEERRPRKDYNRKRRGEKDSREREGQEGRCGPSSRNGRSQEAPATPAPSAPPLPMINDSFLSNEVKRELQQAFPVLEQGNQRVHHPVEASLIKELAAAVSQYGLHANYTLSLLERLGGQVLTPSDWQFVVKAVLPNMGVYLNWKGLWHEYLAVTAHANHRRAGEAGRWGFNMLTGQAEYANDQNNFPWQVYTQIAEAAIRAWKGISLKGQEQLGITQVKQRSDEPFADFVARVMQAVERTFGEGEQTNKMMEQIIWEQCNAECRALIKDRRARGLTDWLKICRDTGGPLTAHGLAAAILKASPRERTLPVCFQCGKPGHMKKECRAGPGRKVPGICPRCRKGKHWANECKSVKDIEGRPLPTQESKNGEWGPKTQVPSVPRAFYRSTQKSPTRANTQQVWTSVPPPESY